MVAISITSSAPSLRLAAHAIAEQATWLSGERRLEMGDLNFRAQSWSAPRRIPAFGCISANDKPAYLLIRT